MCSIFLNLIQNHRPESGQSIWQKYGKYSYLKRFWVYNPINARRNRNKHIFLQYSSYYGNKL